MEYVSNVDFIVEMRAVGTMTILGKIDKLFLSNGIFMILLSGQEGNANYS